MNNITINLRPLFAICDFFFFLFRKEYWIMNHPVDMRWDKKLNELLDNNKFVKRDKYTVELGDTNLWVSNHPYASFTLYDRKRGTVGEVRPKRMTIYKAWKKLKKDIA